MAAIMDAADGVRPDAQVDYAKHFGCPIHELPTTRPRTVVVRAGGRGGKTSRLLGTKALHAALVVAAPLLGRGEQLYSLLVAPTIKLARQALSFVKGYVDGSPALQALRRDESADHLTLRRPDGRDARIEVFAAGRGGAQLRGKSLAFAGLDEAAFFRDEATGVVNDNELYRAILQRVVPGGQCWLVSTPWIAGVGLLEDLISKDFGSHVHALCAVAPTRDLNPNWDPTREIEADLRAQDPDAAEREIDAIPLAAGSQMFFAPEAIHQAVNEQRPQRLPRAIRGVYSAGGDCAFKRNSSALVVVEATGDRYRVAVVEEIKPTPGLPLKPADVVDAFAAILRDYGATQLVVDAHERDEVRLALACHKMDAIEAPDKVASYVLVRKLLHEGRVELPKHPRLIRQLRDVVAKPQPGGGLSISSPRKADGSHGDLVSALVLAIWKAAASAPYERTATRIRSAR